jgi:hypothetical protein
VIDVDDKRAKPLKIALVSAPPRIQAACVHGCQPPREPSSSDDLSEALGEA